MMKIFFFLTFLIFFITTNYSQIENNNFDKLKRAYPNFIKELKGNQLIFFDNSSMIFDDRNYKNQKELLTNPDVEDMFTQKYVSFDISKKTDAGRIRNEAFFKKMYGNTKAEVESKLIEIAWCPKLVNQKIKITTVNDIHLKVQKISNELDQHPELKKYLTNIGGTFNWRNISGSNRLSMHSFGMTIDINVSFSNYWQWKCKCTDEYITVQYINKIPKTIVTIFEKNGFIWGGNWVHFDTMHFEYRPELLLN